LRRERDKDGPANIGSSPKSDHERRDRFKGAASYCQKLNDHKKMTEAFDVEGDELGGQVRNFCIGQKREACILGY